MMKCSCCDQSVPTGAQFCPACGARQDTSQAPPLEAAPRPGGTASRVGMAVLRVLAERALEHIPAVGPALSMGIDLFKAVRGELAAVKEQVRQEQRQPIPVSAMAEALHSLTYAQAMQTVDAVLASPRGVQATAGLTLEQREEVRQQLIRLPSEFDRILTVLEIQEKVAAEEAAKQRRQEEEAERRRREDEFRRLQGELKGQLLRGAYEESYQTVQQMLVLKPDDAETLRVEVWLERRLNRGLTRDTLVGAGIGAVLGMIGADRGGTAFEGALILIAVFTAIGGAIAFVNSSTRRLSRWRKLRRANRRLEVPGDSRV